MSDQNIYSFQIFDHKKDCALTELNSHVLGGNDALAYNSIIEELLFLDIKSLIVDCKNVELMNSSGLGMLVSAFTLFKNANKQLILVNIPDKIYNLFKITHLDKVLTIHKDTESALSVL